MFAILVGAAAASLYSNTTSLDQGKLRTATEEERATREYGLNTTLDQNNDYLFWGQKHMDRLDERVRPYHSYGDAIDQDNMRFDNKARLV